MIRRWHFSQYKRHISRAEELTNQAARLRASGRDWQGHALAALQKAGEHLYKAGDHLKAAEEASHGR